MKHGIRSGALRLTLLFAGAYMVSYITRQSFGAVISEIENATEISRELLSYAVTGSFITYGIGQISSGILGDRISPKRLIFIGLILTSVFNFALPWFDDPYIMTVIWCLNGFAQSFMWPPLVKLMAALFEGREYKAVTKRVSYGSSLGTAALYLVSPLLIGLWGYRAVFFAAAGAGALSAVLWHFFCPEISREKSGTDGEEKEPSVKKRTLFSPLMIALMLAIVIMGMIRDGVTTWMPSYISEIYEVGNLLTILTGVIMPVFAVITYAAVTKLYTDRIKNPIICAFVIFCIGAVSALLLSLTAGSAILLSVLLSALLTASMHGVNLILVCMLPQFFRSEKHVGTVSGVLNSCTYIGSALSTYGVAVVSDAYSWHFALYLWAGLAIVGALITVLCIAPWKRSFGVTA